MELKFSKTNFLKLSLLIEKIISKSVNLPILNNFLFITEKSKLKIIATNLEVGIEVKIPAKIKIEGKLTVPAKLINNTILNLNDDIVNFKKTSSNLKIYTKNTSVIVKGNSVEEFPILPKFKKENIYLIKINKFLNGLKSVCFASSLSNIKPEIASIFIYNKNNNLIFTATDSFRLAEKIISEVDIDGINFLLPYKNSLELIRFLEGLENQEESISLSFNKNQLLISSENFLFFSRLTEGIFPDYKQIIPKSFSTKVVLNSDLLTKTLKASSIFMNNLNEINLIVHPEDKLIELQTSNTNLGEYNSRIPAVITGKATKNKFNLKYLIEGIQQTPSSHIILQFNEKDIDGKDKPLILKGENDESFIYLVMPMKD
jgi:DNA polymerase-3 subunit beta